MQATERRALPDWVHVPPDDPGRSRSGNGGDDTALLTIKEAAAYLRVSTRTVQRQIKNRDLRVVRIGRSVRIDRVELERFVGYQTLFCSSALDACRD